MYHITWVSEEKSIMLHYVREENSRMILYDWGQRKTNAARNRPAQKEKNSIITINFLSLISAMSHGPFSPRIW